MATATKRRVQKPRKNASVNYDVIASAAQGLPMAHGNYTVSTSVSSAPQAPKTTTMQVSTSNRSVSEGLVNRLNGMLGKLCDNSSVYGEEQKPKSPALNDILSETADNLDKAHNIVAMLEEYLGV